MKATADWKPIVAALTSADHVVIVAHKRPDGDALGSILALTLSMRAMDQKVTPVSVDGVPERYAFLPGQELIQSQVPEEYDLIVALDCAEPDRTGLPAVAFSERQSINIDHHATNQAYAGLNWVDTTAAATVELVYALLKYWGFPLSEDVRVNLLAGLLADTIGFRTTSVHAGSLRMAADLVEQGTKIGGIYEDVLSRRSLASAKYWGYGLLSLEQEKDLVWACLRLSDRKDAGYRHTDDADLINFVSTIDVARVYVMLIEQSSDRVKVSWRSRGDVDVAYLAGKFGGGGHVPAAGAMIKGEFLEVKRNVLKTTREYLRNSTRG